MAFEDETPEEAALQPPEREGVIPLISPASQEPVIMLVLGLLLFLGLIVLSWQRTEQRLHEGKGARPPVSRIEAQNARLQTYIVEALLRWQLRKDFPSQQVLRNTSVTTAEKATRSWEALAQQGTDVQYQARALLNAAALSDAAGHPDKARTMLTRAAQRDPRVVSVTHELLPLYAEHPRPMRFSGRTQSVLDALSSGPLVRARNAQLRGDVAGAITALQPGAAAGVRALIYLSSFTLFILCMLITAAMIYLAKHRQIVHGIVEVVQAPQSDVPWGPGTALILISMVFFLSAAGSMLAQALFKWQNPELRIVAGGLAEIVSFVLVIGVFLLALGRKPWEWSVLGWRLTRQQVWVGPLALILAMPLVWLAAYISVLIFGENESPLIPVLEQSTSLLFQIVLVLMAVVMAPVVEETLFRGLLFRALHARVPFWAAAVTSGFFFALLHGQAFMVLPITVLGVTFALVLARTRNLLAPAVAHAMQNGYVTVVTLLGAWALHGPGG